MRNFLPKSKFVNENYCIIPRRQADKNGDGLVWMEGVDKAPGENGENGESEDDVEEISMEPVDPLSYIDNIETAVRIIQKNEMGR